ncbi:hypothetical protein FNF28_06337 [Cafeteria roenbergensis]|uniref:RNA helicase n=1 Tax=Cafeteria roenbergensis TaxID=33653 RepID=A0A5A8CZH7_CAFRO|nr:hypothetical protein FNF28_06337 [Cafeteria roenbergensis]
MDSFRAGVRPKSWQRPGSDARAPKDKRPKGPAPLDFAAIAPAPAKVRSGSKAKGRGADGASSSKKAAAAKAVAGAREGSDDEDDEDARAAASGAAAAAAAPSGDESGDEGGSGDEADEAEAEPEPKTFAELGVCEPLQEACAALGWKHASAVQREAIPLALSGRDVIGLAETGSGKTAAFALPVLQALLDKPQRLFACVLAPTRELAFQIAEQFDALGAGIGCKTAVLVGGVDLMTQAIALARKPHIIIGTPGRLVDHLENTKGFSLRAARYLVLDEADRMLSLDFEEAIDKILRCVPRERRTLLFSATMTSRVAKLQRASLRDPVKVEVSSKYGTAAGLVQRFILCPHKHKDAHLVSLLNDFAGQTGILFVATCAAAQRVTLLLRALGFGAVTLHSKLSQSRRLAALHGFRAGERTLLVATDVASRGLDIPAVDLVVNVDVPASGKDYIHRVGRTARAGRAGNSVTMVTQYDVEAYQRIERLLGKKLDEYPQREDEVRVILDRVAEASRIAAQQLREDSRIYGSGKGAGTARRAAMADAEAGAAGGEGEAQALLSASSQQRRRMGGAVRSKQRGGRGGGRR